jgi:hypothetical protein
MTDIPDDNHIKRTADGRPYIIGPLGEKPKPYTRSSTFSRAIADGAALVTWKQQMLLKGLLENLGSLPRDLDPLDYRTAVPLIETLMDLAGANDASNFGIGCHNLSWATDFIPEMDIPATYHPNNEYMAWLGRYVEVVKPLQMLEGEVFCVNDAFQCAGTLDRLCRLPDGRVAVADTKTGKNLYLQEFAVQVAVYATSMRYDHDTGERTPLHPDLDTSVGVIIHVPRERNGTAAPAQLLGVDLTAGLALASLAFQVRKARSLKVAVDLNQPREDKINA